MTTAQRKQADTFRSNLNNQQGLITLRALKNALEMPVNSVPFIQRTVAMADARGVGDKAREMVRAAIPCAAWPFDAC